MKKYTLPILSLVLVCLFFIIFKLSITKDFLSTDEVKSLKIASDNDQLIFVTVNDYGKAHLAFYTKDDNNNWKIILKTKANIGKKGLGKTKEGDGKTPIGAFYFTHAFGIADNPGTKFDYTKVDDTHYWVSDNDSDLYNQFVSTNTYNNFNKKDSEHIIEYPIPYQYVLNISYNKDGKKGLGSAIFLHCFSKNPCTGGCVAISEENMVKILKQVKPTCKIVIDYMNDIYNY